MANENQLIKPESLAALTTEPPDVSERKALAAAKAIGLPENAIAKIQNKETFAEWVSSKAVGVMQAHAIGNIERAEKLAQKISEMIERTDSVPELAELTASLEAVSRIQLSWAREAVKGAEVRGSAKRQTKQKSIAPQLFADKMQVVISPSTESGSGKDAS